MACSIYTYIVYPLHYKGECACMLDVIARSCVCVCVVYTLSITRLSAGRRSYVCFVFVHTHTQTHSISLAIYISLRLLTLSIARDALFKRACTTHSRRPKLYILHFESYRAFPAAANTVWRFCWLQLFVLCAGECVCECVSVCV